MFPNSISRLLCILDAVHTILPAYLWITDFESNNTSSSLHWDTCQITISNRFICHMLWCLCRAYDITFCQQFNHIFVSHSSWLNIHHFTAMEKLLSFFLFAAQNVYMLRWHKQIFEQLFYSAYFAVYGCIHLFFSMEMLQFLHRSAFRLYFERGKNSQNSISIKTFFAICIY